MKLPRVMRRHMLVEQFPAHYASFYTLLGADVVVARGEWTKRKRELGKSSVNPPKTLELVGDDDSVITSIDVPDFASWWRTSALGHVQAEHGWYLERWRAAAAVGSITILGDITSIKFENGTNEKSWKAIGFDGPQIDSLAIAELTNQELEELRLIEDRVAISHMNNVVAIEREIQKRAGIAR